jgi:hypothetical protein
VAVWVLEGLLEGKPAACLVDSVTGLAFGPTSFEGADDADAFLEWLRETGGALDARRLDPQHLSEAVLRWRESRE